MSAGGAPPKRVLPKGSLVVTTPRTFADNANVESTFLNFGFIKFQFATLGPAGAQPTSGINSAQANPATAAAVKSTQKQQQQQNKEAWKEYEASAADKVKQYQEEAKVTREKAQEEAKKAAILKAEEDAKRRAEEEEARRAAAAAEAKRLAEEEEARRAAVAAEAKRLAEEEEARRQAALAEAAAAGDKKKKGRKSIVRGAKDPAPEAPAEAAPAEAAPAEAAPAEAAPAEEKKKEKKKKSIVRGAKEQEPDLTKIPLPLQNGDIFTGEWKATDIENPQHRLTEKGDVVVFDGYGTLVRKNGSKYVGQWQNGLAHGDGTFYYELCDLHIPFEDVKGVAEWYQYEYPGVHPSPFPKTYAGQWVKGAREGQGLLTYKDGQTLDGKWKVGHFMGVDPEPDPSHEASAKITLTEKNGKLGIQLLEENIIAHIDKKSVVHKEGKLKEGDMLTAVNGTSIVGFDLADKMPGGMKKLNFTYMPAQQLTEHLHVAVAHGDKLEKYTDGGKGKPHTRHFKIVVDHEGASLSWDHDLLHAEQKSCQLLGAAEGASDHVSTHWKLDAVANKERRERSFRVAVKDPEVHSHLRSHFSHHAKGHPKGGAKVEVDLVAPSRQTMLEWVHGINGMCTWAESREDPAALL